MKFEFREEDHTYWLNGERLPGVSEIISPLIDYSKVPPDVLHRAAQFGTAVHKAIKLWLEDELDEEKLDENLVKPLEAFKIWFGANWGKLGRLEYAEDPLYHSKLLFAGTPDLIFKTAIVDIKTRKYNKTIDTVQLAGYGCLIGDAKRKRYVLEIDVKGKTKFIDATNKNALGVFRKLLDRWKINNECDILIQNWKGQ